VNGRPYVNPTVNRDYSCESGDDYVSDRERSSIDQTMAAGLFRGPEQGGFSEAYNRPADSQSGNTPHYKAPIRRER
jgi:hypothetical protein